MHSGKGGKALNEWKGRNSKLTFEERTSGGTLSIFHEVIEKNLLIPWNVRGVESYSNN